MQGSDRKTPVPESAPSGGDGASAGSELPERRSVASAPAVTSDRPPAIESAAPDTPGAPSAPPSSPLAHDAVRPEPSEPTRGEAETPQAASIATDDRTQKAAARRWNLWARVRDLPLTRGVRKAVAVAGGIAAVLGAIFLPRIFGEHESAPLPGAGAASLAGSIAGLGSLIDGGAPFLAEGRSPDASSEPTDGTEASPDAGPPVWRVARLADDPTAVIVDVPIQHRPLLAALSATRVSRAERAATRRVARRGARGRSLRPRRISLTVAIDKSTGSVIAYELASSPADVWQGRQEPQPDGTPRLLARKLKLLAQRVRVRKAVLVGADLHASFVDAGLAPIDDLLAMLDDALDGHAELSDIRPGRAPPHRRHAGPGRRRVRSLGLARSGRVLPRRPGAPSVRVYRFGDDDDDQDPSAKRGGDAKKRRGWYDAKGRQPYHGGWRSPVPLARITSRFNPHRMHPVLHVVMPHNGVDFAAPVGAPVYATAAGMVTSVGPAGPCGNRVEIAHPGNIQSIYCHLSRFAAGLHVGHHVEQRQLIAYVGQTGRVTGPHLHFGIRRARRRHRSDDAAAGRRAGRPSRARATSSIDSARELDAELDGSGAPRVERASSPEAPEPSDSFYEEP